ncbi:MAG: ECF transporter S component [Waltera sp.]
MKKKLKEEIIIMEKKKSYGVLIAGAILLILGIVLAVITHNNSYQESVAYGSQLSDVKAQLEEVEASIEAVTGGTTDGDLDALNAQKDELSAQKSTLSDQKLSAERPYSYSLVLVFFAILLTAKGLYNAIAGVIPAQKADVKKLAQAGLLAALCYIGFAFFKIDIPVGPEKTAFHLGNVFCVLAALLLGGYWGGLAGAIGMTIADLTTAYVTSAPKTFLLKLCIGLIVGLVAHKIFHLSKEHSVKYVTGVTILASACGMAFNVVADPLVGYFYKMYLLGVPQDISKALAKISTVTTGVNAIVAVICASVFYLALRPALKKAGLFHEI